MTWRRALYWAGILLGFGLFAWQFWLAAATMRAQPVALVAPGALVGALGAELLAYLLLMAGWALVMRLLGVRLAVRPVLEGYLLSFLPRYIPGTVWGYVGRNEWLAREHGVAYRLASAGSVVEVILLVATCGVPVVAWLVPGWLAGLAAGACLAAGGVATLVAAQRLGGTGIVVASAWPVWLLILAIYLGFWVTHGVATGLVTAAIGAGGQANLWTLTASFAASWLAGFLAIFVPAGLGVREWVLGGLLARSGDFAAGQPALIAVLGRLLMVVAELMLLALGVLLMLAKRRRPPQGG